MAAAALILAALLVWIRPSEIARLLLSSSPAWLLGACACLIVATVIGALNSFLLVRIGHSIRFTRFLKYYWIAWAGGLVTPGQVGDLATLTLLLRREGWDWQRVLGRSLLDKFISIATMGALGIAGIARSGVAVEWSGKPAAAIATIAAASVVAVGLATIVPRLRAALAVALRRARAVYHEVLSVAVGRPWLVATNLMLTIVKVAFTGGAYVCTFAGVGTSSAGIVDMVLLTTAAGLFAYLPISFNGIGTVEAVAVFLFNAAGVPAAQVLAVYLLLRCAVLLLAWIPSLALSSTAAVAKRA